MKLEVWFYMKSYFCYSVFTENDILELSCGFDFPGQCSILHFSKLSPLTHSLHSILDTLQAVSHRNNFHFFSFRSCFIISPSGQVSNTYVCVHHRVNQSHKVCGWTSRMNTISRRADSFQVCHLSVCQHIIIHFLSTSTASYQLWYSYLYCR